MADTEGDAGQHMNPADFFEEDSKYGEEWRLAVQSAAEYNRKLMLERRLKGPYYRDPHTNTVQVLNSWTVRQFAMPSEEEVRHRRYEACVYVEKKIGKARARVPATPLHSSTSSLPLPRPRTPMRASSGLASNSYSGTPMRASMTPAQTQAQVQMRMQQKQQQMMHRQMMMQQQQRAVQMLQQRSASPLVQARQLQQFASSAAGMAAAVAPLGSSTPSIPSAPSTPATPARAVSVSTQTVQTSTSEKTCNVCDSKAVAVGTGGDFEVDMLTCLKCDNSFHPLQCLQITPESLLKIKSMTVTLTKGGKEATVINWDCLDCKICEACSKAGDDEKLLICDLCDRGFHMYCLTLPLTRAPPGRWVCDDCVSCLSCGTRSPGPKENHRWKKGYRYCESCYKLRGKHLYCPVCNISHAGGLTGKTLIDCTRCKLQLHRVCSALSDQDWARLQGNPASNYVCPACMAEQKGAPAPERKRRRKKQALVSEAGHLKID